MSTPLFTALIGKVRDWSNRDSTILSDSLVTDFIDYSADTCYRELRIPPLEYTYTYPTATVAGETSLQIPPDLTEFIMFKVTDSAGNSTVFDQKMDIRSFSDKNTSKGLGSFTRKGQHLDFYPESSVGDVYELHYYRRLFDMDATYVVNQANVDADNTTVSASGVAGAVEVPTGSTVFYIGKEVHNWLRDENERMVLWGALHYAFEYLGNEEQSAKYLNKQMMAIDELNREEKRRRVSGASNAVTYQVSELL
jgi:hypothetical protein|tara:strand:+ start:375 stop:1130 length:756 start_codon:yes stop_codon:yes gene_type:complete